jgi:hypothetical protein
VGGAGETPLASHSGDGPACRLPAAQLTSALLQPAALNPPADSDVLGLEKPVQVAYGDLVGAGYDLRRHVRISEVPVDEHLDPRQQHPGCARRVTRLLVKSLPGQDGEEVDDMAGQYLTGSRRVRSRRIHELGQKG